jgi:hypothetical protein
MEKEISIAEICQILNSKIHNPIFKNKYLSNENTYKKSFTSLDVIEDTQNAIEEYLNLYEKSFPRRSTLYIYGVLQSLYCQQDGIFNFYKATISPKLKKFGELEKSELIINIRNIRDDIAGHPTDRNYGKEFYYISKGGNSKKEFTYGGFNPNFTTAHINLIDAINQQKIFTSSLLDIAEKEIDKIIIKFKKTFEGNKLEYFKEDLESARKLISAAIFANKPHSKMGIDSLTESLKKLKIEIENRYSNILPDSLEYIYKILNHILGRLTEWSNTNFLYQNLDAEVFYYCLDSQLDELYDLLKEIDKYFEQ